MAMDAQPNALLIGKDGELPAGERIRYVQNLHEPVKILCSNRYEHFHPTVETMQHPLGLLHVFAWTRTTYVAE